MAERESSLAEQREKDLDLLRSYFPEIFTSGPNTLRTIFTEAGMMAILSKELRHPSDILTLKGYARNAGIDRFDFRFFNYISDYSTWGLQLDTKTGDGSELHIMWTGNQEENGKYVSLNLAGFTSRYFPWNNSLVVNTQIGHMSIYLHQGFVDQKIKEFEKNTHRATPLKDAAMVDNLLILSFSRMPQSSLNGGILVLPININPTKFE